MSENILNLLGNSEASAPGPAGPKTLYKSVFADAAIVTINHGKAAGSLMGPPKTERAGGFLAKGEGTRRLENAERLPRSPKSLTPTKKPSVPRHDEPCATLRADGSHKDYVRDNLREAVTMVPPKVAAAPKFTERDEFGKTPVYLLKRKEEEEAVLLLQQAARAQAAQGAFTRVPDAERTDLLTGLRANHNTLYREYSGLPVMTDTKQKQERKMRLERQLADLEADIARVEKHKVILIQG